MDRFKQQEQDDGNADRRQQQLGDKEQTRIHCDDP
jgi:hypothetical protein